MCEIGSHSDGHSSFKVSMQFVFIAIIRIGEWTITIDSTLEVEKKSLILFCMH